LNTAHHPVLIAFEWFCTAVLLTGVALTSFNVFPLNLWILFFGNFGWIVLGLVWRKWSLVIMQIIITLIYVVGIVKLYL
jgi:hypothetical protein